MIFRFMSLATIFAFSVSLICTADAYGKNPITDFLKKKIIEHKKSKNKKKFDSYKNNHQQGKGSTRGVVYDEIIRIGVYTFASYTVLNFVRDNGYAENPSVDLQKRVNYDMVHLVSQGGAYYYPKICYDHDKKYIMPDNAKYCMDGSQVEFDSPIPLHTLRNE